MSKYLLTDYFLLKVLLLGLLIIAASRSPLFSDAVASSNPVNLTGSAGLSIAPGINFSPTGQGSPNTPKPEVFLGMQNVIALDPDAKANTWTAHWFDAAYKIGPFVSAPGAAASVSQEASTLLLPPDLGILALVGVDWRILKGTAPDDVFSLYLFAYPGWRVLDNFTSKSQYTQDETAEGAGIQLRLLSYFMIGYSIRSIQYGTIGNDAGNFESAFGITPPPRNGAPNALESTVSCQVPYTISNQQYTLQLSVSGFSDPEFKNIQPQNVVSLGIVLNYDPNENGELKNLGNAGNKSTSN